MSSAVRSWRNAGSLVVLFGRAAAACGQSGCNFEVLLQTRTQDASFRNSVVFPGGVTEPADSSPEWLRYLGTFGYSQTDFEALYRAGTPAPLILRDNPVLKHISLRITAIRETFEELGLLVCSQTHKNHQSGLWATSISDFDVKHWQKRVSKNPEELLNLCTELKCYPDIWALHYWSSWLTPARSKKRFNTAFFLTALKEKPVLQQNNEVVKTEWLSPSEVLSKSDQIVLYPPQIYELLRLSHWSELEPLVQFARENSSAAEPLFYHATVRARDGNVLLLPGDDLYPSTIDYNNHTVTASDKTILELRESSRVAHRIENLKDSSHNLVLKNFRPKNMDTGDIVFPIHITRSLD